jgi:CDP-diacylglycerol--glycerol-3-phosphate 3-phosphatidyltransferase
MASIYDLKPRFQDRLRPFSGRLAEKGVTANQVTLAAAGFSVLLGIILWLGHRHYGLYLFVPPFLLFRMALNAVDGMMAREHHMKSPLGAMLNELGDVVSDAFLYLPFALVPGISSPLVVLVVLGSVISEMAGIAAVMIGAERRYDGPMGKSDRAFVFSVLALPVGLGVSMEKWANLFLAVLLILVVLTACNRVRNAVRQA